MSDVRGALDAWTDVIVRRDADGAEQLLHPEYVLQSSGGYGSNVDRATWIAGLAEIDTRSLEPLQIDIAEFGDTAVAVGRWRWDASTPTRDLTGEYQITDILLRDGGTWRPRWRSSVRL